MSSESLSVMWLKTLLIVLLAGLMASAQAAASPATPTDSHTYCAGCCDDEPVDCKATAAACKRICGAAALFDGPRLTVPATPMKIGSASFRERVGPYG